MSRTLIATTVAGLMLAGNAAGTETTALTVYSSDNAGLFSAAHHGSLNAGYALVHETRDIELQPGQQTISLDGLPEQIDTEAWQIHFADRSDIHLLGSRLLLPDDQDTLRSHVGEKVSVLSTNGTTLASGTLLATGNGLLISDGQGGASLVRDYAAVKLAEVNPRGGVILQQTLHADRGGLVQAQLDYPTAGIAWRAAYSGLLDASGDHCTLDLASEASIANRSGRDWQAGTLKLVAGEPRFAKASGPRPGRMRVTAMATPEAQSGFLPQQKAMGDYRSYTLDGSVQLPDGSITQVPLYQPAQVECQQQHLFEHGGAWQPNQPQTARKFNLGGNDEVTTELRFRAHHNLPSGYLQVSSRFDGKREILGQARIPDTPKGREVKAELGTSFVLRGDREQTDFQLDKTAHQIRESFRITIHNSGDKTQQVTVREHPNRWTDWQLVSSSQPPANKTTDTLDFTLDIPAQGKATVEYTVSYHWSASDEG